MGSRVIFFKLREHVPGVPLTCERAGLSLSFSLSLPLMNEFYTLAIGRVWKGGRGVGGTRVTGAFGAHAASCVLRMTGM